MAARRKRQPYGEVRRSRWRKAGVASTRGMLLVGFVVFALIDLWSRGRGR